MIAVDKLSSAPINTLWLYLVLGAIFGAVGVGFNALIFRTQDMFARLHGGRMRNVLLMGGLLGGVCGILGLIQPEAAGGGFGLIPIAAAGNYSVGMLMFIFITRIFTTLLCFGSGAPGGIFAPMLALGTLFGTAFGLAGRICSRSTASRRAPSPSPAWGRCSPPRCAPADRHRAGAGNDRQLPTHFTDDHHLPRRHGGGAAARRQAAVFVDPGPHAAKAGGAAGAGSGGENR